LWSFLPNKSNRKLSKSAFTKSALFRAESLEREGERFKQWLELDFHGEMQWLEREPEKRFDPNLIFPEAKSIVVVALNYYTPHEHEVDDSKGKVSRYAWGDDYHDVLKEKLRELLAFIKLSMKTQTAKSALTPRRLWTKRGLFAQD
jgi:epoxyqueuosine reductase QueG